jgi:hypothetical protein
MKNVERLASEAARHQRSKERHERQQVKLDHHQASDAFGVCLRDRERRHPCPACFTQRMNVRVGPIEIRPMTANVPIFAQKNGWSP